MCLEMVNEIKKHRRQKTVDTHKATETDDYACMMSVRRVICRFIFDDIN